MKILVAISSRNLLESTTNLLIFNKYEIKTVFDGVQVLDALKKENFDLLVLDRDIQRLPCEKVMKSIREENYNLPILLIVNSSQLSSKFLDKNVYADEYLTCPFRGEDLVRRINQVYDESKKDEVKLTLENTILSNKFYFLENKNKKYLTIREYLICILFFENFEKILTYEQIYSSYEDENINYDEIWKFIRAINNDLDKICSNLYISYVENKGFRMVKKND